MQFWFSVVFRLILSFKSITCDTYNMLDTKYFMFLHKFSKMQDFTNWHMLLEFQGWRVKACTCMALVWFEMQTRPLFIGHEFWKISEKVWLWYFQLALEGKEVIFALNAKGNFLLTMVNFPTWSYLAIIILPLIFISPISNGKVACF